MLTLRGENADGSVTVILGLTEENITRLTEGEPILVPLDRVRIPGVKVLITYGETERHVVAALERRGLVPPGTASDMPTLVNPGDEYHVEFKEPQ